MPSILLVRWIRLSRTMFDSRGDKTPGTSWTVDYIMTFKPDQINGNYSSYCTTCKTRPYRSCKHVIFEKPLLYLSLLELHSLCFIPLSMSSDREFSWEHSHISNTSISSVCEQSQNPLNCIPHAWLFSAWLVPSGRKWHVRELLFSVPVCSIIGFIARSSGSRYLITYRIRRTFSIFPHLIPRKFIQNIHCVLIVEVSVTKSNLRFQWITF